MIHSATCRITIPYIGNREHCINEQYWENEVVRYPAPTCTTQDARSYHAGTQPKRAKAPGCKLQALLAER